MTEHELKTWPEYFQAIVENRKPFEYRLNDRNFQAGDVLWLREYVPPPLEYGEGSAHMRPTIVAEAGHYTGRELRKSVTYILDDKIGPTMREGFVVMGLGEMEVGGDVQPLPWVPMSNPVDIAVVGKNIEELGEAVSALARALIQGIDSEEPSTAKVNRMWVQEELADVSATNTLTIDHFALDREAMGVRHIKKIRHLTRWFAMIPEALKGRP